jgi:alkanesulfonate monooxygenase SsuD/methylene tetrahydromethanopterin reductase-like flavin-dependent oxidoreductase (luciferase family)
VYAAAIGSNTQTIGLQAVRRLGRVEASFARRLASLAHSARGRVRAACSPEETSRMGSVVKKRRKRMAKKKHRKLLRKTRVQRRRLGK